MPFDVSPNYANRAERRRKAAQSRRAGFCRPKVYDLAVQRAKNDGNSETKIPSRITLILPNPTDTSSGLLYIDQIPMSLDMWSFEQNDMILTWQGAYGGGHLYLNKDGQGARGNIGQMPAPCAVIAGARAQFSCSVALDAGVSYLNSGTQSVGLSWDPTSSEWTSASWVENRLLMTYTVLPAGPIDPPSFTFEFEDQETGAIPWDPQPGETYQPTLELGEQNGLMVWNLAFKSKIAPPQDRGIFPPTGPDTVFPYWLQAVEDASASTINGAMEIDAVAPNGTLVGMQGVRSNEFATGYYQTSTTKAPFGVFDGKLIIGGRPVGASLIHGNGVSWRDLDAEHQAATGLPREGQFLFKSDGSSAYDSATGKKIRRMRNSAAIAAIAGNPKLYPDVLESLNTLQSGDTDTGLTMQGLLPMTPFVSQNGQWNDVVQAAVRNDLADIMNSYIPADMWSLVFGNTKQPTLTGELAKVANSPVEGVADPAAWYQSLATAVMTNGMAEGNNSNCKNMNGPRSGAWLKEEVSTSPVYHTHGQELFQYEWGERYPVTSEYLLDQKTNATSYEETIDSTVQNSIDDINNNVITNSASQPDLKQTLIDQVTEVGQYAKTNKLYWAFGYFHYNTTPTILANIAAQIAFQTGSNDGTTLSRYFQQTVTVLTALDPSGYFAQQYIGTLNTFLATNILPSMYGFNESAADFDLIQAYLQTFVDQNIDNEDQQIAEAAAQIQSILDDDNADEILHTSIQALGTISDLVNDTLALPYVANNFVSWFTKTYPKFARYADVFSGLFVGGVAALAIFNLIREFKSWDQLDDAERAEVVLDTAQLGLQIVGGVVKRGVRVYAIFSAEGGLTGGQRAAAMGRVLLTGDAEALDESLVQISNTAARYIGDTAGTVGVAAEIGETTALLDNEVVAGVEEASWAVKIFGKNFNELITTRIGPLFILAGIGLSLYFIIEGASGISLASDIVNIISGSLMVFATIGSWAVEFGYVAGESVMATVISFAGPLAIVAALAGVGLMLYELFKTPPDPIKEFVDQYVRPAGFYVPYKASSIDYAYPYADTDNNDLMMLGFTLSTSKGALRCNNDGTITAGGTGFLPDYVWQSSTDGVGMSTIFTVAQPDSSKPPVLLKLSLMSDNSVSFAPPMKPASAEETEGAVTVVTQTWLSNATTKAKVTDDDEDLVSLGLTFQPVLPDSDGNYAPSQAAGWLVQSGSGVAVDGASSSATHFTLDMSAIAPNYMAMADLSFTLDGKPLITESYGPSFGVLPSTPLVFTDGGAADYPDFLTFDPSTGSFSPNGQRAATAWQSNNRITATSDLLDSSEFADFTVTVAAATLPT